MKDIRIPRASGLVVKTAAKQECTAEGPGFESRLVHFYCSWGLLGCLFVPPRTNLEGGAFRERPKGRQERPKRRQERPKRRQERPKSRQERPKSRQESPRRPQKSAQKGPQRAPGAPPGGFWAAGGSQGPSPHRPESLGIGAVATKAPQRPQSRAARAAP